VRGARIRREKVRQNKKSELYRQKTVIVGGGISAAAAPLPVRRRPAAARLVPTPTGCSREWSEAREVGSYMFSSLTPSVRTASASRCLASRSVHGEDLGAGVRRLREVVELVSLAHCHDALELSASRRAPLLIPRNGSSSPLCHACEALPPPACLLSGPQLLLNRSDSRSSLAAAA